MFDTFGISEVAGEQERRKHDCVFRPLFRAQLLYERQDTEARRFSGLYVSIGICRASQSGASYLFNAQCSCRWAGVQVAALWVRSVDSLLRECTRLERKVVIWLSQVRF